MLEFYSAESKKKFVNLFVRGMILNTPAANFYFLEEVIRRKEETDIREKWNPRCNLED